MSTTLASTPLLDKEVLESLPIKRLYNMLRVCRPDASETENAFVATWLAPLGLKWDKFGNLYKAIGKDPIVAWSCHTDTVHRQHGYQKIGIDDEHNIRLHKDSKSNCLGADDTAGLWLMTEMLMAKRPGLYIFHRAEEVGTKGSKFIAGSTPKMMEGIQACIAFDRRGTDNVITHQRGMRCCSDEFAASLAGKLLDGYKADPTGLYTDSASYVDLVGECTNVSVGYFNEHMSTERLNLPHVWALREKLLKLDTSDLVFKRKPGEKEPRTYNYGTSYKWGGAYGNEYSGLTSPDYDPGPVCEFTHPCGKNYCPPHFQGFYYIEGNMLRCTHPVWQQRLAKVKTLKAQRDASRNIKGKVVPLLPKPASVSQSEAPNMSRLVAGYPDEIAALLVEYGFDAGSLRDEIMDRKKVEGTSSKQ